MVQALQFPDYLAIQRIHLSLPAVQLLCLVFAKPTIPPVQYTAMTDKKSVEKAGGFFHAFTYTILP